MDLCMNRLCIDPVLLQTFPQRSECPLMARLIRHISRLPEHVTLLVQSIVREVHKYILHVGLIILKLDFFVALSSEPHQAFFVYVDA